MATTTQLIPIKEILADENFNCRGRITFADVQDLATDMHERGQLQACTVVPISDNAKYKYKLIAGFRRFKAATSLEWADLECKVNENLRDELSQRFLNLGENVQRSELNIVQEARALGFIFAFGLTEDAIKDRINKTRGWVQLRKMVYNLPEDIYPDIESGVISQTNIRELYTVLRNEGKEKLYENVRWIKDERAKGRTKASIKVKLEKEEAAKQPKVRTITEINMMQDRIVEMTGKFDDPMSKVLAWVSGRIPAEDCEAAIKEYCDLHGYPYVAS